MNSQLNRDTIELYYFRFKESPYYILSQSVVIFLVSIILIFQAIIPQFSSWFSINDEIAATRERIEILENNITFVNQLDGEELENDLSVVFTALPAEKDFQGIVEAVNGAVVESGVFVDDYNFEIGEIATNSADLKTFFPVLFTVAIESDIEASRRFFEKIQEALPIAEIVNMTLGRESASLTLAFYFKVFPQDNYNIGAPVRAISSDNQKLLGTLRERKENLLIFEDQSASSSAEPPF